MDTYDPSSRTIKWTKGGFQGARGCDQGQEYYVENIMEEVTYCVLFCVSVCLSVSLNECTSHYVLLSHTHCIFLTGSVSHIFFMTMSVSLFCSFLT